LVLSELAIRESLEMSIFITCYLLVSVTSLSNNLSTTFYNRTYEVRKIKITWLMLPNNVLNVHIIIPSTKSRMITCGPSTKKKQNPKKIKIINIMMIMTTAAEKKVYLLHYFHSIIQNAKEKQEQKKINNLKQI
jgi:hypothetical protein